MIQITISDVNIIRQRRISLNLDWYKFDETGFDELDETYWWDLIKNGQLMLKKQSYFQLNILYLAERNVSKFQSLWESK